MGDIYAMQRANGDWFALDDHGRFRVPVFRSSGDAMQARQRNSEMLLFKPVALDDRALKEIVPRGDGNNGSAITLPAVPSGELQGMVKKEA